MQKLTKHNQGWIDRIVDQIIEDAQYFADNRDGNVNKKTKKVLYAFLKVAEANFPGNFTDGDELEDIVIDKLAERGIDWDITLEEVNEYENNN